MKCCFYQAGLRVGMGGGMVRRIGTTGGDALLGSGRSDRLSGLAGSDTLAAGAGNDQVTGGEGSDILNGGGGDDVLYGFGFSDGRAALGAITATRVGFGFEQPVFAISAPDDPGRLFIVEKTGQIKLLDPLTGQTRATTFLDIPANEMDSAGEGGLLGLAFGPDYATSGRFFVFVTNSDGDHEIRRYTRSTGNPDLADPDSGDVILTTPHPVNTNHNGGWIGFGPDGML
jgi:hypothetical protein